MQFLILNHIQYSTCGSYSQRVSAKSTEKLDSSLLEALGNLLSTDNSWNRKAIAHSFPNTDNIRYYSIILKCPKCFSYSSKSCLHLITDAYNSSLFQFLISFLIKIPGRNHLSSATLHKLTNKSSIILSNYCIQVLCVVLWRSLTISNEPTIGAGAFCNSNMIRFFNMLIPFIRTNLMTGFSNTMISSLETNNPILFCVNFSHLHC